MAMTKEEKREKELLKKCRKSEFKTFSGIPIKRVYSADDLKDFDSHEKLGDPGEYPFTRGLYPNMYRQILLHRRLGMGYGLPKQANQRFKYLHAQGGQSGYTGAATTSLYDGATNYGLDSDDPLADGEIGKMGVAIDTIEDMEILMDGFPLDETFNNMVLYDSGVAAVLLGMYIGVAEKQNTSIKGLMGSCLNEPFQTFVCQKCSMFPLKPSLRLCLDIAEYTVKNVPRWNPISVYGNAIRESGGNAIQEIAFALAHAMAYTEAAMARGLDVDDFAPRMTFYHNVNNELFEEASKYRAYRRMYAGIMKNRYGAKKRQSLMLRVFSKTSGVALTAQQPLNNIIRSTVHTLAALLGGSQGVFVASFDEALSIPTETAATIAARTSQILIEESGVADTVDPLAGSYYVENLTNAIESNAFKYLDKVEEMGKKAPEGSRMMEGVIKGIESGFFEAEIAGWNYQKMRDIESGKRTIVGVNKYQVEEDVPIEVMKVDLRIQKEKIRGLKVFKKKRDKKAVQEALDEIKKVCGTEMNVMPALIKAAKKKCTLGEMITAMKQVFGEYRPGSIS
jgi:methylmalonyl-CoA mutase, N-terminal domain